MSEYPERREIDGVYFRCKRDDRWENVCWTDMTKEERDEVSKDRPIEWWKSMCEIMTDTLRQVCDSFDVVGRDE